MTNMLTDNRDCYKPFNYPWAYTFYKQQEAAHWGMADINLASDIEDWNNHLTPQYVATMSRILRYFTQADVNVAASYYEKILPLYRQPELRMMFGLFASTEAIHVDCYSALNDQLGLPESDYSAFLEVDAMRAKFNYGKKEVFDRNCPRSRALMLAKHGAFGEGLHLFGTFVVLLNPQRSGRMMGTGSIVTYSIKDESIHILGNIEAFKTEVRENPSIWDDAFKKSLYDACREYVEMEDAFIDACFIDGDLPDLKASDLKLFIRHLANHRLLQLGLKENYVDLDENPLQWVEWILSNTEFTNFFEGTVTEYAAGQTTGSWEEAWDVVSA